VGGTDPVIRGVAPLDRAGEEELSFLANPRYLAYFRDSRAGAVILTPEHEAEEGFSGARIVVSDVHLALAHILPVIYPESRPKAGIHPTAVIGEEVQLGENSSIGPYAVIGDRVRLGDDVVIGSHTVVGEGCELGDGVYLHSQVTLYPGVQIGPRSIVHSGARIGVDGFGYVFADGMHQKVPQVGGCIIGPDVEIGANTTIDRGSVGSTEVGENVKIDNLVHIGHNVEVGDRSIIVAQVGIAGSTVIGRGVTLGGQVGVSGHLEIGDRATVAAQGGVFGDLEGGVVYSGYPARPHRESLRAQANLFRLPGLVKRIRALEAALFGGETREE